MNWKSVPLRRIVTCLDGRRVPLNSEQRSYRQGRIPYWGAGGVMGHVDSYLFDEELILLGEDGAPFFDRAKDVAFHVNERVWVNNHIHVLRPNGCDARFLTYSLNSVDYGAYITGSTRDKLTQEDMKAINICLPELEEQRRIADFLDAETSYVHRLIDAKESASALMEERRTALISEYCLRGTSEEVEFKESGVGPIGRVPRHWEVVRNKVILTEIIDLSETGHEELLTVSHLTGVTPRSEKNVNMFEAESTVGYKVCQPNDLVINTLWAWMGALGVARTAGIVSPAYGVYRFTSEEIDPSFYDYLYRTPAYVAEMTRFSKGVWTSRLRLYPESFLALKVPVPPITEQVEIVSAIHREIAPELAARSRIRRSVELLRERRQALITAAVTGQFDVSTASGRNTTQGV